MKKRIRWAAVALAALLLAGCGGQATGGPEDSMADGSANTAQAGGGNESAGTAAAEQTDGGQAMGGPEDFAAGSGEESTSALAAVRIGAMSGPTAMGMVKLMSDAEAGSTMNRYEFAELSTEASAFVAPLAKGELDIAAVPSNLAATLYNNTDGGIVALAVNNNGVLTVVENGENVTALADLAGKTVNATGQGAVPEYILRYLLSENGIDPDADVTINWCADTTEAGAYTSEVYDSVTILPQPFATALCIKCAKEKEQDERMNVHIALDLNDEWDALDNGCSIVIGVIVARKEFVETHPLELAIFMDEYAQSVAYAKEDAAGAAQLIEKYGIVGSAAIAEKALPGCHLSGVTGKEMKRELEGFLNILYEQNPQSVGGTLPGDDFYFEADK